MNWLELNLTIFYYFYMFISAAIFAGFLSGNMVLHLIDKKTNEELSTDSLLYGFLCSMFSVGWLVIILLFVKGDKKE